MPNSTTPSRRRPRGGVRASVLAVGAVGMAASLGVGGLGISALADANATLGEVDDLSAALSAVQDIETSNSDVTGWQASYAWDTRRIGGAAAVADDNANRAGFLDSADTLRAHLAAVPTDVLTGSERETFATIQDQWDAYFEVDAQAVAAYAKGTPAAAEDRRRPRPRPGMGRLLRGLHADRRAARLARGPRGSGHRRGGRPGDARHVDHGGRHRARRRRHAAAGARCLPPHRAAARPRGRRRRRPGRPAT